VVFNFLTALKKKLKHPNLRRLHGTLFLYLVQYFHEWAFLQIKRQGIYKTSRKIRYVKALIFIITHQEKHPASIETAPEDSVSR